MHRRNDLTFSLAAPPLFPRTFLAVQVGNEKKLMPVNARVVVDYLVARVGRIEIGRVLSDKLLWHSHGTLYAFGLDGFTLQGEQACQAMSRKAVYERRESLSWSVVSRKLGRQR